MSQTLSLCMYLSRVLNVIVLLYPIKNVNVVVCACLPFFQSIPPYIFLFSVCTLSTTLWLYLLLSLPCVAWVSMHASEYLSLSALVFLPFSASILWTYYNLSSFLSPLGILPY